MERMTEIDVREKANERKKNRQNERMAMAYKATDANSVTF